MTSSRSPIDQVQDGIDKAAAITAGKNRVDMRNRVTLLSALAILATAGTASYAWTHRAGRWQLEGPPAACRLIDTATGDVWELDSNHEKFLPIARMPQD